MRLIDAEELIEGRVDNDPVVIAAMCAPNIDAVAVVRCKDCFHAYRKDDKLWCVFCGNCVVPEDDYCFYGVRDDHTDDCHKDYYAISQAMGFSTR